jgi:hypothetical protein
MTMRISVVNFSMRVGDGDVLDAIRAINRQIAEDFQPVWHQPSRLVFAATLAGSPAPELLTSDAAIYICDTTGRNEIGYHDANQLSIPYAFVFTELADILELPWSTTLSHEALELTIDPQLNQLVVGPDPRDPAQHVTFLKEICDPVQASDYAIDGIAVANFVTPDYYVLGAPRRNTNLRGLELAPFDVLPGGYVDYVDGAGGKQRFGAAGMRAAALKDTYFKKHPLRRSQRHAVFDRPRARRKKARRT